MPSKKGEWEYDSLNEGLILRGQNWLKVEEAVKLVLGVKIYLKEDKYLK